MPDETKEHGWTAVPRSLSQLVADRADPQPSKPVTIGEIPFPETTPLVQQVVQYAKDNLPTETYNHSMRVYYFGE